jgi:hypothetical protein
VRLDNGNLIVPVRLEGPHGLIGDGWRRSTRITLTMKVPGKPSDGGGACLLLRLGPERS